MRPRACRFPTSPERLSSPSLLSSPSSRLSARPRQGRIQRQIQRPQRHRSRRRRLRRRRRRRRRAPIRLPTARTTPAIEKPVPSTPAYTAPSYTPPSSAPQPIVSSPVSVTPSTRDAKPAQTQAEAETSSRAEAEAEAHGLGHEDGRVDPAKGEAGDSRGRDLDRCGRSGIRDSDGLDGPRCAGTAHARSLERRLAGRPRSVGAARSGRMKGKLALLLVPAALFVLALPGSASSALPPAPQPSCSPGSGTCSDWHQGAVTVFWNHACGPTTISSDTGGTPVSCTAANAEGSVTSTTLVRKDGSPPGVRIFARPRAGQQRLVQPPRPGRSSQVTTACRESPRARRAATYSGPDGGRISISGSCTDGAGNTGSGSSRSSTTRLRPASK